MRNRIIMGVLVVLVALVGWVSYNGWQDAQAAHGAQAPERMEPAFVGTIHVQLDADLLERLDRDAPRLTLETNDGTRVAVTVWRARGDLAMTQFLGLQPSHYQTLVVDWGTGDLQLVPIDINLAPPRFN